MCTSSYLLNGTKIQTALLVITLFTYTERFAWLLTLSFFSVLNSTLLPKHYKGDDLDCGRRRITGLPPPAGSLSAALIAIAVTGQEYHCRLTGSLRYRLPQPVLRSDGYRLAPCLAVFDRILIFSLESYRWSWRILRSRFAF